MLHSVHEHQERPSTCFITTGFNCGLAGGVSKETTTKSSVYNFISSFNSSVYFFEIDLSTGIAGIFHSSSFGAFITGSGIVFEKAQVFSFPLAAGR